MLCWTKLNRNFSKERVNSNRPNSNPMKCSNSDFWTLVGIISFIGAFGIYEGNELHPVFYSQSITLFAGTGYLAFKIFYLDNRVAHTERER